MAAEITHYMPDDFLQKSGELDALFTELGIPLPNLGEVALKRHLVVTPDQKSAPKTREQQAAEYFGKGIFPSAVVG